MNTSKLLRVEKSNILWYNIEVLLLKNAVARKSMVEKLEELLVNLPILIARHTAAICTAHRDRSINFQKFLILFSCFAKIVAVFLAFAGIMVLSSKVHNFEVYGFTVRVVATIANADQSLSLVFFYDSTFMT